MGDWDWETQLVLSNDCMETNEPEDDIMCGVECGSGRPRWSRTPSMKLVIETQWVQLELVRFSLSYSNIKHYNPTTTQITSTQMHTAAKGWSKKSQISVQVFTQGQGRAAADSGAA